MDLNNKVTQLEDEIKVLKKEVQAVLLDLRENMLNRENPFMPQTLAATSQAVTTLPPDEEKQELPVDEKPKDGAPANEEEVALPSAITGAFPEDESASETDGPVLAWKPAGDSEKGEKPTKNVLEMISSLVGWVETSVTRLGFERTQAILDISEMMGHLSPEMKGILVKFMRPGSEPPEQVAFKDYMASLIELAGLLGKKNDPNNVLFYTLYHGMYSMTEGKDKHG